MLHYSYLEAIWHFIHYVKNHKQEFYILFIWLIKVHDFPTNVTWKTKTQKVCPRLWQKQILVHEHIQNVQMLKNRISTNVWFHVDNSWMTKWTLTEIHIPILLETVFFFIGRFTNIDVLARMSKRGSKSILISFCTSLNLYMNIFPTPFHQTDLQSFSNVVHYSINVPVKVLQGSYFIYQTKRNSLWNVVFT